MPLHSIGFPRQRHEAGEVRDLVPELFAFLEAFEVPLVLEEGYGSGLGFEPGHYRDVSRFVTFSSAAACLACDLVVVLRCPPIEQLATLRPGAALLSMLHFPTRPERVAFCEEAGIRGFAMDQVVDDLGRRLVENLDAVARNGVAVGMATLARQWKDFASSARPPLNVLLLGAGAVGGHALRWAVQYGDPSLRQRLAGDHVAGVKVTAVDFELANNHTWLTAALLTTDLLVDATQRPDPSKPVVKNEWLDLLPEHAVIVDLAADPYDTATTPPRTKAVEGVPQGNLDQYIFEPADAAWTAVSAPHEARRTSCSCYSWPGIRPLESSRTYSKQLEPVLRALIEVEPHRLSVLGGRMAERAVARASHRTFSRRAN